MLLQLLQVSLGSLLLLDLLVQLLYLVSECVQFLFKFLQLLLLLLEVEYHASYLIFLFLKLILYFLCFKLALTSFSL